MNTDARRLDHRTLTELRKRAVASVQAGQSPEAVAGAMGVNLRTVFRWVALYRSGGWDKLDAHKRGGRPPKLEARALKWIYDTVLGKSPLQLKFPFALWTTSMVRQLVAKRFGVHLSHSSVCRLLAQMGMSAQRPLSCQHAFWGECAGSTAFHAGSGTGDGIGLPLFRDP